jgi:molybdopterin molybdotransferase
MAESAYSVVILSFEEARLAVEEEARRVRAPRPETVDLLSAAGRVLGEPIVADRDIPPFPRSARDGFGVRVGDLAHVPAKLKVVGEIRAGERPEQIPSRLNSGEAVSIMTGAPVPIGADAVVMVEYTSSWDNYVEIGKQATVGENIVARGSEAREGSVLLNPGTRLNEVGIGLAATAGKDRLQVYQRPQVAVLSTGDEIVPVGATPGPTQIRNSNSYSLAVQILEAGATPVLLPIAPDEPRRLRELIEQGLRADLLLLAGGVSMGKYDLVEEILGEMQAEFFFTGAKIQPGRPVVFGRVPCGGESPGGTSSKYFFGLPGNPVSTMVTFELFARPMIEALAGMSLRKLLFVHARLRSEIRVKPGLKRFLPALLSGEFEGSQVELVAWQGSGDIAATARANCYVVVPPDCEHIAAGEWVAVMMR